MSQNSCEIAHPNNDNWLLDTVKKVAISPEKAHLTVAIMQENYRKKHPSATLQTLQDRTAQSIVDKYVWLATCSGGATSLTGVIPGLGTILSATLGAGSDTVICMKIQVDMCMCLADNFGYDITSVDAQNLSLLIAGGASLEKAGVKTTTSIASKTGVKLIRQYLKGAVLQTIKQIFKKIGITFTRKALEKMIPLGVGVVIGAGANYFLTQYVGKQAVKWFEIDRAQTK